MAELTITGSNVVLVSGNTESGYANEVIDAGEFIYTISGQTNNVALADNSTQTKSTVKGIALNSALAVGQPVQYAKPGSIVTVASASLTVGVPYFLASTGGKIELEADVASGEWLSLVALAVTTSNLYIVGYNAAVQIA